MHNIVFRSLELVYKAFLGLVFHDIVNMLPRHVSGRVFRSIDFLLLSEVTAVLDPNLEMFETARSVTGAWLVAFITMLLP